jgi:tRNA A-37 threonylcarbamoyl transferase component Bud32
VATCPSCNSIIEETASVCWHCGVSFELASGDSSTAAPTLAVGDLALDNPSTRRGSAMIGREIIGQYIILDKLGEGGMGEVYLADQPALGRQVAIKVVHAQAREREFDELMERFRNEAKAAASLESPHIVKIFNWGELEDGTLFMAMEYLSGRTLSELIRELGPLDAELVVSIATQICTALGEAHAAGIVHRDLKPSNIMLIERGDQQNFVKVLDFGVAKLEGSDITRSGMMFGTPQYMSPEQLRAETIDGRSDLYSLGVMIYEMLVGKLPFSSPTTVGFITAHLHDAPPALPRSVPKELAEVVHLLMSKEANDRPANAAAVAAELEAALGGRSPAARRRARRRAMRNVAVVVLGASMLGLLGWGGTLLWRWRTELDEEHNRELEAERARVEELQARVTAQEAEVERIRTDAESTAAAQLQASASAREQRLEVIEQHKSQTPRVLDEKTRALLTRSREQLEAELRGVFEERRIPPSEIADVWRTHQARVAALAAGELDDATLREDLAALIVLYRKGFEREAAYDDLPLADLEQRFMSMATRDNLDETERRAQLDAIRETYQREDIPEVDRPYFRQLAVAKLIREQAVKADEPPTVTPPIDTPKPIPPPEDGPLPSAEDDGDGGAVVPDDPLPSLDE